MLTVLLCVLTSMLGFALGTLVTARFALAIGPGEVIALVAVFVSCCVLLRDVLAKLPRLHVDASVGTVVSETLHKKRQVCVNVTNIGNAPVVITQLFVRSRRSFWWPLRRARQYGYVQRPVVLGLRVHLPARLSSAEATTVLIMDKETVLKNLKSAGLKKTGLDYGVKDTIGRMHWSKGITDWDDPPPLVKDGAKPHDP